MIAGLVLTTLRLYRIQILVTGLILAALVAMLLIDVRAMQSLLDAYAAALVTPVLPYVGLAPAAIGAFWGVPAVGREYEAGTVQFALTQSVSRRSWILMRLTVLGALIAIGGAAVGWGFDTWLSTVSGFSSVTPLDAEVGFSHIRGLAPVGWWLLGFAVGVTSGAILRRTVPGMAVTIVGVAALLIARNLWLSTVGDRQALSVIAHVESVALIAAAVILLGVTCWRFERVRA